MNSIEPGEKSPARRAVEASWWRVYLTDNDLETTPEFESWLAHPDNRGAWRQVQQPWDLIGDHATSPELIDLRRGALGRMQAIGRQRWGTRFSWLSRFRRAAVAAGILILAVGGAVTFKILGPDVYQTGPGERRVVTLADGSQVQLDSLTKLQVSYSERARDLELIKGQARFDVAHDVQRPFSVLAAGKKIVATGTAFNVDLLGKDLYVTLLEGKVVILPQDLPELPKQLVRPPAPPASQTGSALPKAAPSEPKPESKPIELEAGQQLTVLEDGATKVAVASVQRATAWQSGQIVVEDEPLSSVVARVNRYSTRPVTLSDESMASLRISGVFNAGDVDGFISTVTRYLPVKAEEGSDAIHLSARSRDE